MSYYYKYSFISPEGVYATIIEELKSYFDTGAVDSLLFPLYLNKCLNKLGKSSYVIKETVLYIENFEARLPDNFHAVREAWMCGELPLRPYTTANSFYSQTFDCSINIVPVTVSGDLCGNPTCTTFNCPGCPEPDCPDPTYAVYKTNYNIPRCYRQMYLLKPGNISAKQQCDVGYTTLSDCYQNPGSSSIDTFDIRDNKFVTNFRTGVVHLIFYSDEYDCEGNQMMPDNYRIKEFVEAFIKYKVFETLTNQTNDETFNQLQQKLIYYKQQADEAYIMAESEIKKQTAHTKMQRIKMSLNRFNMYEIPNGRTNPYGRRRNGQ